jgi:hypothetical protein
MASLRRATGQQVNGIIRLPTRRRRKARVHQENAGKILCCAEGNNVAKFAVVMAVQATCKAAL